MFLGTSVATDETPWCHDAENPRGVTERSLCRDCFCYVSFNDVRLTDYPAVFRTTHVLRKR
jgi:hypothetical protein